MDLSFKPCPNCSGAIVTEQYLKRFGQCRTCYERNRFSLDERLQHALG